MDILKAVLMQEVAKRIDNTPVGFEEVEDACAATMAEMLEDLRRAECDTPEIVDVIMTTLGTFSARTLHRLFDKDRRKNKEE